MNKILVLVLVGVGLSNCSSTKKYTIFDHLLRPSEVARAPNLTVYPTLLASHKVNEPLSLSWAGLLENIYLKKDAEGRVVLRVRHHYLAVNSAALEKDKDNVEFELSEKTGGVFECRIPFQKDPSLAEWQEYLDKIKAVGCTGPLIGFNSKKQPILQAQVLEGFAIKRIREFEPEMDEKTGLLQLDEFGRPKFKIGAEKQLKLE